MRAELLVRAEMRAFPEMIDVALGEQTSNHEYRPLPETVL
jgi:hypothetical protein